MSDEDAQALDRRVRRIEDRLALGEPCPSMLDLEDHEDGPTLSLVAVQAVLGLGPDTLRDLIDHADLRGVRHGRNYKVLWCSLRSYLYRSGALPLRPHERTMFTRRATDGQPPRTATG